MCFYILLGLALFYTQSLSIGIEQKPQEKIITMSLAAYEPEVVPPLELPKEEPIPEPIEEIEPEEEEPVVEVVKEVIPEPVIEKIIPKSKPIVKKIVKKKVQKKKRVKKKVIKKKPVKKKIIKPKSIRKKSSRKKVASSVTQNAFLSRIRSKINNNKTYPRIAQRRGMQGSVKVRFTILKSGRVGNISVSGPKVFHKSAKNAVRKSFPIATKNAPISLPTTVNFTLRYQIR
jgi:protein TonB